MTQSMPFVVEITPDNINDMLKKAILESAIGTTFQAVIHEEMEKLKRKYDNPLKEIVEREIARLLAIIVKEEYGEIMKDHIRQHLTEQVLGDVVDAAWGALHDQILTKKRGY